MVHKLPIKEFKQIYARVPRLSVDLLIKKGDAVLLTLREIEPKGFWHLPGGTVLFDETIEQAVKRIAKEELGIKVIVGEILGVIDFYKSFKVYGHAVSIVYSVSPLGTNFKLNDQAKNVQFFAKLPNNTLDVQKVFLKQLDIK